METRRLGRTGIAVGAVGVHASWREREADGARRALAHAFEQGVDVVVVDPTHDRAIEKIVGEVVREMRVRDRAVIATRVVTEPRGPLLPPRGVQAQLEASLRASRLEVIPLALLAWDDRFFYEGWWHETRAALEKQVRAGKVMRWGIAPNDPRVHPGRRHDVTDPKLVTVDEVRLGVSESIFEVVAIPYGLLARAGVDALFDSAKRHDTGVIAMGPLQQGLLGGAWDRDTTFAPDDWRRSVWTPAKILAELDRVAKLVPLSRRETDSLAELALRFVLERAEITCVAPALRTREQVDVAVLAADDRRLTPSLLQRIDEALS